MAEASPKDVNWHIDKVECQLELYIGGKFHGKILNSLFWPDDDEVEFELESELDGNADDSGVLVKLESFKFGATPFSSLFRDDDLKNSQSFVERLDKLVDEQRPEDLISQPEKGEENKLTSKAWRKRRRAGEFSGRQIALKKLEKEKKTEDASTAGGEDSAWPPPFLRTVQSMRQVLLGFSEGEEEVFTEDHATAMRVYFSKKLAVSGKDGTNSLLTNYFKLALLPKKLYDKAVRICELYEEGELLPPSATKQRKRKNVSSSSFSFLRGFNPQSPQDQHKIGQFLDEWMATKKRPTLKKQNTSEDQAIRQKRDSEVHRVVNMDEENEMTEDQISQIRSSIPPVELAEVDVPADSDDKDAQRDLALRRKNNLDQKLL
ncbi:hypothetical protein OS493_006917 [Desmophyllum pertusum]|uniref:Uncharacterized protein n=1 Tax=Desmophyllum pertusum TaxID=174260 RepID=A0A9W9ZS16_9CNID|nr:hypothetical protein OS493_006917 [Desmophyllum pertusum]